MTRPDDERRRGISPDQVPTILGTLSSDGRLLDPTAERNRSELQTRITEVTDPIHTAINHLAYSHGINTWRLGRLSRPRRFGTAVEQEGHNPETPNATITYEISGKSRRKRKKAATVETLYLQARYFDPKIPRLGSITPLEIRKSFLTLFDLKITSDDDRINSVGLRIPHLDWIPEKYIPLLPKLNELSRLLTGDQGDLKLQRAFLSIVNPYVFLAFTGTAIVERDASTKVEYRSKGFHNTAYSLSPSGSSLTGGGCYRKLDGTFKGTSIAEPQITTEKYLDILSTVLSLIPMASEFPQP